MVGVIGYLPTGDEVVAVVVTTGEPETTLCVSPFTKPE
jgi:hypothetical protein